MDDVVTDNLVHILPRTTVRYYNSYAKINCECGLHKSILVTDQITREVIQKLADNHYNKMHLKPRLQMIRNQYHGQSETHRGLSIPDAVRAAQSGAFKRHMDDRFRKLKEQLLREESNPQIPTRLQIHNVR